MQHNIRIAEIGPMGKQMDQAITACVHCGFCLPACPTYQELGAEMDSPRGRIYLMKKVLEGQIDATDAQPHIDRCLGCLACETSCPSGVPYSQLISPYRAERGNDVPKSLIQRLQRLLVMQTLPYPGRFRLAVRSGRWMRFLKPIMPRLLRSMFDLMPDQLPKADKLPPRFEAIGERRARVALLTGCVQQAMAPDINRATIQVLLQNGVEVIVPPNQSCCGSLAWHVGEAKAAKMFARRTMQAFPDDVDAVIVNAAGCGSGMHDYPIMFDDEQEQERAVAFSRRVMDVSVFLDELGFKAPAALNKPVRMTYHDACHLAHGQQVRKPPRHLLQSIEGLELLELDDGERCCGSAGTYNIEQPLIAASLGKKKVEAIDRTRGDAVATGNIGCMVQIRSHLPRHGPGYRPVLHTMQVLALAYRGKLEEVVHANSVAADGRV